MKKLSFYVAGVVSVAVIFSSCKLDTKKNNQDNNSVSENTNITVPKERTYTNSELEIGRRICSNLKTKRKLYDELVASASTSTPKKFRFRGELKNCESPTPYGNATFLAGITQVTTDYEYQVTDREAHFPDVITDQSGVMEIMCDNLIKDNVNNYFLSGNSTLLVNFLIQEGFDRFEVIKKTKGEITSLEAVMIFTQPNQTASRYMGVEKERIRYTTCADKRKFAYKKQTWIEEVSMNSLALE